MKKGSPNTNVATWCALWCLAAATALGSEPLRLRGFRTPMGTYMAITVYASERSAGQKAIDAAFARVERLEASISTYRKDSAVSKLNRSAGGPPVPVGAGLWAVLRRAAEVSKETGGAFDITAGPLIRVWKNAARRRRLPPDRVLAIARGLADYKALRLIPEGRRAQLLKPRMRVDLGAIGKGYIVDQAVAALRGAGIRAALVDAGGDIYALGAPPGRDGWLIGVRDPARPKRILRRPLRVKDCAVATSGDYEQFTEIEGRRFSHIVDPRTGWPIQGMTSVTVVAPDATTADAYATAASVLGPQRAVAFAEKRPGVEFMILHRLPPPETGGHPANGLDTAKAMVEGALARFVSVLQPSHGLLRVESSGFGRFEVTTPPTR